MSTRRDDDAGGIDLGVGWDGLRDLSARMSVKPSEAEREADATRVALARLVDTDDGRRLIAWLKARTLDVASVPHVGADRLIANPAELASYVLWNEARKALVLELADAIEKGRRDPDA